MAQAPVRNWQKLAGTLRDFETWLGDAVPGAMDLDCLIERRGRFLIFEGKPIIQGCIYISLGQLIALRALAALTTFDVWLVGERRDEKKTSKQAFAVAYVRDLPRNLPVAYHDGVRCVVIHLGPPNTEDMSVVRLRNLVKTWWEKACRTS